MGILHRLKVALGAAVFALVALTAAQAQEIAPPPGPDAKAPAPPMTAWNGSYTQRIDLQVPAFRGLEPDLGLSYDSARGVRNIPSAGGILGVGWSLDGVSAIQRVSGTDAPATDPTSGQVTENKDASGRGTPAYNYTDSYTLDGAELLPCEQITYQLTASPTCFTPAEAGSDRYTARYENYLRIRRFAADNHWEVTSKDGTVSTYEQFDPGESFSNTYRWYLKTVTDRDGNHVDYTWSCEGDLTSSGPLGPDAPATEQFVSKECNISTIEYFNKGNAPAVSTIRFAMENRKGPISYGTGKDIRYVTKRLRYITVWAGSSLIRGYELGYEKSNGTQLDRLISVQEIGSDAVSYLTSNSGDITQGTRKPPFLMKYSDTTSADGGPTFVGQNWAFPPISVDGGSSPEKVISGEFNGDGFGPDFITYTNTSNLNQGTTSCSIVFDASRGDGNWARSGPFSCTYRPELDPNSGSQSKGSLGPALDVDGDGIDEVLIYSQQFHPETNNDPGGHWDPAALEIHRWTGTAMPLIQTLSYGTVFPYQGGVATSGDFDGDGKQDLITMADVDGVAHLFRWQGNQLVMSNWANIPRFKKLSNNEDRYRRIETGDFNGDGRTDLLVMSLIDGAGYVATTPGGVTKWRASPYLSTGSSFSVQPSIELPWAQDFSTACWVVADHNGDGLSDIVLIDPRSIDGIWNYRIKLLHSLGRTFDLNHITYHTFDGFPFLSEYCADRQGTWPSPITIFNRDFNADGRADLALWGTTTAGGSKGYRILLSRGEGYENSAAVVRPYGAADTFSADGMQDFNGDGLVDLHDVNSTNYDVHVSIGDIPDLLTKFTTPLGGVEEVTYQASTKTADTKLPFIMQVVKTLKVSDGRGGSATTSLEYGGGSWSAVERQFLGFRYVVAQLPCVGSETVCPKQVTYFNQTVGCNAKMSWTGRYTGAATGNGTQLTKEAHSYATNTRLPFICRDTDTKTTLYNGTATQVVGTQRVFNSYGDVIRTIEQGDLDTTDDDRTTTHAYYPNTTGYLVACKARDTVYDGVYPPPTGSTVSVIADEWVGYDGQAYPAVPTACHPTSLTKRLTASGATAVTFQGFDTYGNLEQVTAPGTYNPSTIDDQVKGEITKFEYNDPGNTHLYVTRTTLPPANTAVPVQDSRFTVTTEWNAVCGQKSKETGLNGADTSWQYDAFCRLKREDRPLGDYTLTAYTGFEVVDAGVTGGVKPTPGGQYVTTSRRAPSANAAATVWSRDYKDGLGRSWRTIRAGSPSSITSSVAYNDRGLVEQQTAPYFSGGALQTTSYGYDAADRVTSVTHPDGTSSTMAYGLGSAASASVSVVSATDEVGNLTKYTLDAEGRLVGRTRYDQTTGVGTVYSRDPLGRIVGVKDPLGNQWTYSFDVGGRRYQVNDPDLGSWTYTYDAGSRLATQTDARRRDHAEL